MTAAELIRRHFDLIDRGDMAAMAELFEPDAVYVRPGYEEFVGRQEILRFYTSIRTIRDGRHSLAEVLGSGSHLAVQGCFEGHRIDGLPTQVRFSDFFELGESERFTRRHTYFAVPQAGEGHP